VSLFPAVTILVNRPLGPGSYVNGHWVPGPTQVLTLQGSVHPASGQKLQTLPEGKRDVVGFEIYSDQQLYASDPETMTPGDLVTFSAWDLLQDNNGNAIVDNAGNNIALTQGWPFEIVWAKPWNNGLLPHCEAIAVRVKEGGSP
jgi:hypothetical protein